MSGKRRQASLWEMQFYASFADNRERDDIHQTSRNLLWILNLLFFFYTWGESGSIRGQLWISLHLPLQPCCTKQCWDQSYGTGKHHTDWWCQLEQPVKCECSIFFLFCSLLLKIYGSICQGKPSWGGISGGLDVKTDREEEGIKKNNINWGKSWKSDGGKGIKILFRGI